MWKCPKCQEKIEDTFTVCWNCGTSQDGTEDPNFQPTDEWVPEIEEEHADVSQSLDFVFSKMFFPIRRSKDLASKHHPSPRLITKNSFSNPFIKKRRKWCRIN